MPEIEYCEKAAREARERATLLLDMRSDKNLSSEQKQVLEKSARFLEYLARFYEIEIKGFEAG